MIELRKTHIDELTVIHELGEQTHAQPFLNKKSMADYKREFLDENTTFLCIVNSSDAVLGYFILVSSEIEKSIQLKRILISQNSLGIGQSSLTRLEEYCTLVMGGQRIWLDVYDNNYRAIHIYKKLGYELYKTIIQDNRKILYYDKAL